MIMLPNTKILHEQVRDVICSQMEAARQIRQLEKIDVSKGKGRRRSTWDLIDVGGIVVREDGDDGVGEIPLLVY